MRCGHKRRECLVRSGVLSGELLTRPSVRELKNFRILTGMFPTVLWENKDESILPRRRTQACASER